MATAQRDTGPGGPVDPASCKSATQYVARRLREAEEPVSPKSLANEYGCVDSHMRQTFADLADEGVIERVARGKYVHSDTLEDVEPLDSDVGSNVEDTGSEDGEMPTQEEYERQHSDPEEGAEEIETETETDVDEESEADEDTGVDELEEAPAPVLPMDPYDLTKILVAALVLWVAYRALTGGVDTDVETSDLDEEQDGGDEDGGLTGGLA